MKRVLLVVVMFLLLASSAFAFNKTELLADLSGKEFVSSVSIPELIETKPDGTKQYVVNIREVVGNAAIYRNVFFYVVNEGQENELAYYKDTEPKQSLASTE